MVTFTVHSPPTEKIDCCVSTWAPCVSTWAAHSPQHLTVASLQDFGWSPTRARYQQHWCLVCHSFILGKKHIQTNKNSFGCFIISSVLSSLDRLIPTPCKHWPWSNCRHLMRTTRSVRRVRRYNLGCAGTTKGEQVQLGVGFPPPWEILLLNMGISADMFLKGYQIFLQFADFYIQTLRMLIFRILKMSHLFVLKQQVWTWERKWPQILEWPAAEKRLELTWLRWHERWAEALAAKVADFINSEGFIIQSDTGKVRYKAMRWVVDRVHILGAFLTK